MFHGDVIKKEVETLHKVALARLDKKRLLKVVKYEDTVMEKALEKQVPVKRHKKKHSKKKLQTLNEIKEEEMMP